MDAPKAERLTSKGYGFEAADEPGELLPWSRVEELLTKAKNYWLVTSTKKGRPHAAPVWAVWEKGRLLFSTSVASRKARNLEANPRVVVHLDHDDAAVIVEGICERITDRDAIDRFGSATQQKYEWEGSMDELLADPSNGVYAVHPHLVFSFGEPLGETGTRWVFDS
jgi:general stress protein 26